MQECVEVFWLSIEANEVLIRYLERAFFKGIQMHSIIFMGRIYVCFDLVPPLY